MSLKITKQKLINYALLLLSAATIITIILTPLIVDNKEENWDNEVEKRVYSIQSEVIEEFNQKILRMLNTSEKVKKQIRIKTGNNQQLTEAENGLLSNPAYGFYAIQVKDSLGNLVLWNSSKGLSQLHNSHSLPGEVYFKNLGLFTFLSLDDTLKIAGSVYTVSLNSVLEKNYNLENQYFIPNSLTEFLSSKFNTRFEISYYRLAQKSRDGRLHSIDILNNFGNKIGVVNFQKPSRDYELNLTKTNLDTLTSLFVILLLLSVFLKYLYVFKRVKSKIIRFVLFSSIAVGFRILLFVFNLPSRFLENDLLNASYFSSVFAYGIVRSPLEFFITAIVFLSICVYAFNLTRSHLQNGEPGYKIGKIMLSVILFAGVFVYLMLLRGFGASIKSVIFDSTLRYFKEPSLLPEPPAFLMHLNVLILGFCSIIMGVVFIVLILRSLMPYFRKHRKGFLVLFFLVNQGIGYLFDVLQKDPQGTDFSRIVFITLTVIIAYIMLRQRRA